TAVDGLDSTYYLVRQLQWFILGLIGFVLACLFPYKKYQKMTLYIVIASFSLLIAVLIFGDTVNRATRSVSLFGFNIQPSEFIKLLLIIYLSSVYSKKQKYIGNFVYGVLPPLIITACMILLIVLQPDIGTATIIMLIVGTIIVSSGIRMKHLALLTLFAGSI